MPLDILFSVLIHVHNRDVLRQWTDKELADKTMRDLNRVLAMLRRLGNHDFADHVVLSIPRVGGCWSAAVELTGWHVPMALPPKGWHPPLVVVRR